MACRSRSTFMIEPSGHDKVASTSHLLEVVLNHHRAVSPDDTWMRFVRENIDPPKQLEMSERMKEMRVERADRKSVV